MPQKNSRNGGNLIDLDLLLPKNKKKLSHGWLMVMGEPKKFLLLPPPPTESVRTTAIPENLWYYPPPPLNLPGLRTAIPENFCYYPPPPNLVGLRRSRKIGPPQKKNPGYAVAANDTDYLICDNFGNNLQRMNE